MMGMEEDMASYFTTYTTEQLKEEIDSTKRKIRLSNSEPQESASNCLIFHLLSI